MSPRSIVIVAIAIFALLLWLTLAAYEVGLLTFGRTVVQEARYVEPIGNVSAIVVHADIGNVVFMRGPRPEVCVDVNITANGIVVNPPHVNVSFAREGDTLVVEVKSESHKPDVVFGSTHVNVTVFAVIPDYVKVVNVCDGAGSVKLYGASLEEIGVQTSAGEIRLVNVSANTANLTDEAGNIRITGGNFTTLDLVAKAGSVKVSNASVGSLGIVDKAGNVKVSQVNVSDAVIEDNAGDIGLSNVLGDVNATAKAGNIEVYLGVKYNVVYYLTTDAGDIDINLLPSLHVVVTLPGVMASPPVIYAEAKTGSVKVNYV